MILKPNNKSQLNASGKQDHVKLPEKTSPRDLELKKSPSSLRRYELFKGSIVFDRPQRFEVGLGLCPYPSSILFCFLNECRHLWLHIFRVFLPFPL